MEIQVRTGPWPGLAGGNVCDATGLASRFRDDGKWDWEKELKHPSSTVYSTKYASDAPLFSEGAIPLNRWIGMKFIVCNIDNNAHVKFETYIDSVSDITGGPPPGGGHWDVVGSMIDSGSNWPGGDISGCPNLSQNMAVTVGNGTMLIRTDGEACDWTMLSLREINPNSPTEACPRRGQNPSAARFSISDGGRILRLNHPVMQPAGIRIFDAQGRVVQTFSIPSGGSEARLKNIGVGVRIVAVGMGGKLLWNFWP